MPLSVKDQIELATIQNEVESELNFKPPNAYKTQSIDFIDPAPKPFIAQIPLVEYFERIKRLKADKWQRDFCRRLTEALEKRDHQTTWALIHAESQLGKSSILAQCYPAWILGHDPLHQIALATYNVTKSQDHSKAVIGIMNRPEHKDIFPKKEGWISPNVSKEKWSTPAKRDLNDAQFSFNPVGLQSGLVGSSYDTLLIDDPYSAAKEAFSEQVRKNLCSFWDDTAQPRIKQWTNIFGMFHRYHVEDLAGYLLNTGNFDYWRYATVADGDYIHEETGQRFADPLGRKEGEYISERRLATYRAYVETRKNPRVWNSQNQGRPTSAEGDFFQVAKIKMLSDPAEIERERQQCIAFVRAWDNAATQGAGDFTAGALMGMKTNGEVIVFDMKLEQLDTAKRVAMQKATAVEDGLDVSICIPQEVAEAGKTVVFWTEQFLKEYTVIPRSVVNAAPGSTAKARRAYNFSIAVNSGQVSFVADGCWKPTPGKDIKEWNKDVKRAMRNFLFSEFDDPIDAMGDGYNELFETVHKGLVIHNYRPQRNLIGYNSFAQMFPYTKLDKSMLKIPKEFTVYAGVKINPVKSFPTSAIIAARGSEMSGLGDSIICFAEYKAYDGDVSAVVQWLERQITTFCQVQTDAVTVWLHPDSVQFEDVIVQKLGVATGLFDGDDVVGLTEMDWNLMPLNTAHPFHSTENAAGLYLLVPDKQISEAVNERGFMHARQEFSTWGYDKNGEPSAVGGVLECLRMITAKFATHSTPLTEGQLYDKRLKSMLPKALQNGKSGVKMEVDGLAADITIQMAEARLRRELRDEGEFVPSSPFDDEDDYRAGLTGGY